MICAVQDVVELAEVRLAERPAVVGAAALVSLVVDVGPVLDVRAAAAAGAARAELGVERVHRLAVDAADREGGRALRGCVGGSGAHSRCGCVLDLQHVEVAVEELVDRGVRPGAPLLVHLGQQAGTDLLGLLGGLRPGWHDLGEVVRLLRDRVEARVDAHAVRPARQGLDLSPDALPGLRRGGHGATAGVGCSTYSSTRVDHRSRSVL
jgi:hypothetical protein